MNSLSTAATVAFLAGVIIGGILTLVGARKLVGVRMGSVTKFLFVAVAVSAISWVFISYGIAIYSAVRLGQVYTMAELSEPAITGILCALFAKVLENVFEHNDGALFGRSNKKEE